MESRIERALQRARSRLRRLSAAGVPGAVARGALLVDIRPAAQRTAEGTVAAALAIERDDVAWVVICSQGYISSLAAAALQDLGLYRATDMVGGYQELSRTGVLVRLG